jgi:hypothetical protein
LMSNPEEAIVEEKIVSMDRTTGRSIIVPRMHLKTATIYSIPECCAHWHGTQFHY